MLVEHPSNVTLLEVTPPAGRRPQEHLPRPSARVAAQPLPDRDLEGVLAKARAAGAIVRSDDSSRSGAIGVKLAFFEDPEGNVLELVEPV